MKINDKEVLLKKSKLENMVIDKIIEKDNRLTIRFNKNGKRCYNHFLYKKCDYCNQNIYINIKNLRNRNTFCSTSCYTLFKRKEKDIKNYNILSNIESLDFMYYLGLLASDGTIMYPNPDNKYKGYRVRIQLHINDRDILDKLHNIFGGKISIFKYGKKHTCVHEISNEDFVKYLISIGFTVRKSKTLNIEYWFNTLHLPQKMAFLRGFIDGDGSIYNQTQDDIKWYKIKMSSCSNKLMEMILNFLKSMEYNAHIYYDKNCTSVSLHGKFCVDFARQILVSSPIFLNRKNKAILELLNFYNASTVAPSG